MDHNGTLFPHPALSRKTMPRLLAGLSLLLVLLGAGWPHAASGWGSAGKVLLLAAGALACYAYGRRQAPLADPLLFDLSPLPMLVCDPGQHAFLAANAAALALTGYRREALMKLTLEQLVADGSRLRQASGDERQVRVILRASRWQEAAALLVILANARQPAMAPGHAAELARCSAHDTLTGLPQRQLLIQQAEEAIRREQGSDGRTALMLIDLDRFKQINKSLGHPTGDEALRMLARRLQAAAPASTTLARLGSDEFILLVPAVRCQGAVTSLAQAMLAAVSQPMSLAGRDVFLTATIGISLYPEDGTHGEELLRNASLALDAAKTQGGNSWQLYQPPMQVDACARMHLESCLYKALEQQQFMLLYQPRVNAATGNPDCVEALVRWQAPGMGLLPPDRFMSILEETGLIVPVGQWVFRTACMQAADWQQQAGVQMKVAINISARQLRQPDFVAMVAGILQESGIAPGLVELELTESVLMQQNMPTLQALGQLKALGVQLAVDDFGTGYSALNYLKHFPVDSLKIDKSFVQDIHQGTRDAELATAIISMGHSLHLKVVAEGVESQAQLDFLRERHCDEIQGFYTGKPMRAEEIPGLIGRQPWLPGLEPAAMAAAAGQQDRGCACGS